MLNRTDIIGRAGRDVETFSMNNGGEVCKLSVAVTEKWKDGEKTTWFNVVSFNEHLNKVLKRYVRKGDLVHIAGQMQSREYEKDGIKHKAWELVLQKFRGDVTLLGNQSQGQQSQGADNGFGGQGNQSGGFGGGDLDDEIPF